MQLEESGKPGKDWVGFGRGGLVTVLERHVEGVSRVVLELTRLRVRRWKRRREKDRV